MRRGTRVLHVTTGLGLGGAETMLYRLVRALHCRDGQSHAVASLTPGSAFDFAGAGVEVDTIDLRAGPLSGLARLRSLVRRTQPDVMHAWMYHGSVASAVARPLGPPLIWGIHHSLHDLRNEPASMRVLIRAGALLSRVPSVRRVVYVSGASRDHHAAHGYPKGKAVVIPNGFDCDEFRPDARLREAARRQLGIAPDDVVIGSFGRWHPVKDHGLLLSAFALAARDHPAARLLLAGLGMDAGNAALAAAIERLGIGPRVVLLGAQRDMPQLYNAIDAYVLSSRSESFPNVLGEACACEVPCVTTDVGDARRIVGDTGRVVPPGDVEAMSGAMRELLAMAPVSRRAQGARARRHVVASFGIQPVTQAYARLYDELARHPQRPAETASP